MKSHTKTVKFAKSDSLEVPSPELRGIATPGSSEKKSGEFLDLNKALVPQMFQKRFSKQFYLDEVHKPRFLKGSALFFNQPYLEMFTRTPWYVIPLVWGPIVLWHLNDSWKDFSKSSANIALLSVLYVGGILAWSILEYVFHRFLFHMENALPSHQIAYSLHFLLHGVHHFLPMDRMRLVMPPILFAFLCSGPYVLFRALIGQSVLNPLYAGVVTAYVCYDMGHYFFHHGSSNFSYIKKMKTYHMAHHYKDYNKGYGVTSMFWDNIFRTTFEHSKVDLNFAKQ